MPLFDYKCPGCGNVKEVLCSFEDTEKKAVSCLADGCYYYMEKQVSKANFKVWHYEAGRMDAEADMKKCGMEI